MTSTPDPVQARLLINESQGKLVSLIFGQESLAELRNLIFEFSQAYLPKQNFHPLMIHYEQPFLRFADQCG